MFARALDRMLDLVWDAIEPLAGECPVCSFLRGALLGAIAAVLAAMLMLAHC